MNALDLIARNLDSARSDIEGWKNFDAEAILADRDMTQARPATIFAICLEELALKVDHSIGGGRYALHTVALKPSLEGVTLIANATRAGQYADAKGFNFTPVLLSEIAAIRIAELQQFIEATEAMMEQFAAMT